MTVLIYLYNYKTGQVSNEFKAVVSSKKEIRELVEKHFSLEMMEHSDPYYVELNSINPGNETVLLLPSENVHFLAIGVIDIDPELTSYMIFGLYHTPEKVIAQVEKLIAIQKKYNEEHPDDLSTMSYEIKVITSSNNDYDIDLERFKEWFG